MHRGIRTFLAVGLAAGLMAPAAAQEANRCTVSATPVNFGTFTTLTPTDARSTGTITYNCTQSQPVTIMLSRGDGPFFEGREMMQGASRLSYNIYLDAAGTILWGDGTGGSQVYRDPAPPPDTNVSFPIYARVPPHQREATVGVYQDSLIVTINY